MDTNSQNIQPIPPFSETNEETPEIGAEHTLSQSGPKLWKTLLHKSACLSCSWGTGGQKGGFTNEEGEKLQRCMKSVEAIAAEIKPAISTNYFEKHSIAELQQLTSMEADRLGRLSFPMILRDGKSHYDRISWQEVYQIAADAFTKTPERVASYSSGRSSNEAAFLLQLMISRLFGSLPRSLNNRVKRNVCYRHLGSESRKPETSRLRRARGEQLFLQPSPLDERID